MKEKISKEEQQSIIARMEELSNEMRDIVRKTEDFAREEDNLVRHVNELYVSAKNANHAYQALNILVKCIAHIKMLDDFDKQSIDLTQAELDNINAIEFQKSLFDKYIHGNTTASKLYLGTYTVEVLNVRKERCSKRVAQLKEENSKLYDMAMDLIYALAAKFGRPIMTDVRKKFPVGTMVYKIFDSATKDLKKYNIQ